MSKGRAAAVERLQHILAATQAIAGYVDRGRAAFDADSAVREAILYQIIVIGEAAKATLLADPALEAELPEVEWSPMARMRDRVTHHYWSTDPEIVWATASTAVPELQGAVEQALARLRT